MDCKLRRVLWCMHPPMKSASRKGPMGWLVPSRMPLSMSSAVPTFCKVEQNKTGSRPRKGVGRASRTRQDKAGQGRTAQDILKREQHRELTRPMTRTAPEMDYIG